MIAPRSTAMIIALTRTTRSAPATCASIVAGVENVVATPSLAKHATLPASFVQMQQIYAQIVDTRMSHVVLLNAARFDVVTIFTPLVISRNQIPPVKGVAVLERYAVKEPKSVTLNLLCAIAPTTHVCHAEAPVKPAVRTLKVAALAMLLSTKGAFLMEQALVFARSVEGKAKCAAEVPGIVSAMQQI